MPQVVKPQSTSIRDLGGHRSRLEAPVGAVGLNRPPSVVEEDFAALEPGGLLYLEPINQFIYFQF